MSDKQSKIDEIPVAKLGRKLPSEKRVTAKGVALGAVLGVIGVWVVQLAGPNVRSLFADDAPKQTASTESADIQLVDEGLVVPESLYVSVKNPDGMTDERGRTFGFGDRCDVAHGATAKLIAVEGERMLMHYNPGHRSPVTFLECPDGTLFFLDKEEYLGLVAHKFVLLEEQERERREKETVRRLTESESPE